MQAINVMKCNKTTKLVFAIALAFLAFLLFQNSTKMFLVSNTVKILTVVIVPKGISMLEIKLVLIIVQVLIPSTHTSPTLELGDNFQQFLLHLETDSPTTILSPYTNWPVYTQVQQCKCFGEEAEEEAL